MKLLKFLVGATLMTAGVLAGCSGQSADIEDVSSDSDDAALTASNIKGTWTGTDGRIYSITFSKMAASTIGNGLTGYRFDATIDTDIRCITTPCPSSEDVVGVYKVTGSKLTLASFDRPDAKFAKILGDYKISSKSHVTKLTLTKNDGTLTEHFVNDTTRVKCGFKTCGEGLVCCNSLMGICTPAGMACIQ